MDQSSSIEEQAGFSIRCFSSGSKHVRRPSRRLTGDERAGDVIIVFGLERCRRHKSARTAICVDATMPPSWDDYDGVWRIGGRSGPSEVMRDGGAGEFVAAGLAGFFSRRGGGGVWGGPRPFVAEE